MPRTWPVRRRANDATGAPATVGLGGPSALLCSPPSVPPTFASRRLSAPANSQEYLQDLGVESTVGSEVLAIEPATGNTARAEKQVRVLALC